MDIKLCVYVANKVVPLRMNNDYTNYFHLFAYNERLIPMRTDPYHM